MDKMNNIQKTMVSGSCFATDTDILLEPRGIWDVLTSVQPYKSYSTEVNGKLLLQTELVHQH